MTLSDEQDLLREIYAAGLDPARWPLVMEKLGRAVGEVKTHLFSFDAHSETSLLTATGGFDPDQLKTFDDYYAAINPWAPAWATGPLKRTLSASEMVPTEKMKRTEFYQDWVKPQDDIIRGGGAVLMREPGRILLFGGNIREKDGDQVEPLWLDLVNRVAPAIRQAVEVSRAIAGLRLENLMLRRGADPQTAPVLLLAANGRILYANRLAEDLVTQGQILRVNGGNRLTLAAAQPVQRAFDQALRLVFEQGRGAQPIPLAPDLILRVLPLDTSLVQLARFDPLWWEGGTVALLLLHTPPGRRGNARLEDRLIRQHGLTRTEAEVAIAINEGQTLAEIADARRVSVHTVRNQVKSALLKTGHRRQADLSRLVEFLRNT